MESGIYIGEIRHRRFRPKKHFFTYPIFMTFLDIDRIPELMSVSRFTSYERWNWASFRNADHFGDANDSIRRRLSQDAGRNQLFLPDGKIFVLTHLRYLGYSFNPVSFYFCYDAQERLQMIVAEVNNTFGETHNYWLSQSNARASSNDDALHFTHEKYFHVSPFMKMDAHYDWTFTDPADQLLVQQSERDSLGLLFDATLRMNRRDWSAKEVRRTLMEFPWMTAKVVAAIYWEAARLLIKGVPSTPHPGPGKYVAANHKSLATRWSVK